MPTFKAIDVSPGMRLGADLLDPSGRLLIPAGIELTPRHCRGLAIWGINEVQIDGDEVEPLTGGIAAVDMEMGRSGASRLYCHCDRAHAAVAALFELTAARLASGRMEIPEGIADAS